jgi:hypothetical protein
LVFGSQLPDLQTTLLHKWQLPAPSHVPSRMQVDFASGPHDGWPVAGAAPAGTLAQTPTLLLTLQA